MNSGVGNTDGVHDDNSVAVDREHIRRIQAGDTESLRALIHSYAARLEASAFLVVRREDLAQDAVQDVFIKLWEQREQLDIRRTVASYLFRAVRFRAISLVRHEAAEQRLEEAMWSAREFVVPVERNHGAIDIESREFAKVVREVLQTLPARCREIFLMHRVAGMSYGEIAATLEIAPATIHNQMHRASKALMVALQRNGMV